MFKINGNTHQEWLCYSFGRSEPDKDNSKNKI